MSAIRSNRFAADLAKGVHDLTSITVKMVLLDASYTPDPDHNFADDIVAHELSGTGYSRQALTTKAVTQDDTNDLAKFTSDDVVFTGINAGTIGYTAFIRDRGGADSANELLVVTDPSDLTTNGGNVAAHCPTNGWFYL